VIVAPNGEVIDAASGAILARKVITLPWSSPMVQDGILYVMDERGASAIRLPAPVDGKVTPEVLWTAKVKRDRYYATPVVEKGLIFNITRGSHLTVLNAKTGELAYEKKLDLGKGMVYPSPVLAGDRLYVSNENGTVIALAPESTYRELSRHAFQPFRSCPVAVGGRLYIRTLKGLCCIGKE
jgi:outer membrane protein assembly factor BamB